MSLTTLAQKVVQGIHATSNAKAFKALLDGLVTAANAGTLTANALSADSTGRAVMATGFFNEATATAKFVAGAITGTLLKAGCISADATGRALFAAGVIDSATAASIFATGAIPQASLASVAAPATRSGAGAIDVTKRLTLFTSTGAGNALTLANGTYAGQAVRVIHSVKGSSGTGVITPTTFDHTSVTLTNAYASVEFEWTGTTWTLGRLIDATVTG